MDKLAIHGGPPTRAKDNFLIFGAPHIEQDEIDEVVDSLQTGWIGTGPKVHRFEKQFREYKGSSHAIAVNSCTAALHLAMIALGIGEGDEVITTPLTFCATINSIIHCGATPVLADCSMESYNIDPREIEKKINSKTKAILPVHFAGNVCDMDEITSLCRLYDLLLIEDCAHAIESTYKGQKAGTFGDIGCFSFYVTKNVVTGEGGMVITEDEKIAERVMMLALHGMSKHAWKRFSDEGYKHYQVIHPGFKYNMMDIQAALGIHQLKKVDTYHEKRQRIWQRYNDAFSDLPVILPADSSGDSTHAYHLYTVLLNSEKLSRYNRDYILDALTAENIGIGVHYMPVFTHPFYRKSFNWQADDFPNAQFIGDRTLSLPISPSLTDDDVEDVIQAFRKVITTLH
ncbi:MAG: DegT/DnrJ/EryC1/StrS family aminotransferase [Desulfobulbaceae bacterium]|nr:MAG: DegT/DnrJ/EryC1/StrS family aminotransferase [Desulfobulbaceae bacterium]